MQILPYMEEQSLRDAFDPATFRRTLHSRRRERRQRQWPRYRPWHPDSSAACPSDPYNKSIFTGLGGNWARNNYAASVGRGFLYPGWITGPTDNPTTNPQGWQSSCFRGVMGPNVAVATETVSPMAQAKRLCLAKFALVWMKPTRGVFGPLAMQAQPHRHVRWR